MTSSRSFPPRRVRGPRVEHSTVIVSPLTRHRLRWARAVTAFVVVASAGCHGDSVSAVRESTTTNHVLRVQANGAGSGTVTSPDASPQLSCTIARGALSGVCAMAYPANSAVRLVATPNATSTFVEWSGGCTGTDQCVVDMSQERTVTAAFAEKSGSSERDRLAREADSLLR